MSKFFNPRPQPSEGSSVNKLSELENDVGFVSEGDLTTLKNDIASKVNIADISDVAKTGLYSDLIGTPNIPTKLSHLEDDSRFIKTTELESTAEIVDLRIKVSELEKTLESLLNPPEEEEEVIEEPEDPPEE